MELDEKLEERKDEKETVVAAKEIEPAKVHDKVLTNLVVDYKPSTTLIEKIEKARIRCLAKGDDIEGFLEVLVENLVSLPGKEVKVEIKDVNID